MFGKDRGSFGPPSTGDEAYCPSNNLIELAEMAASQGKGYEAVHLYLAAFEAASSTDDGSLPDAVEGMRKAWRLSLDLKDRSLAEHVFERMEPTLSSDEVASHAEALQRLALEKLEEFGLSRDDLKDMADMVSADFAEAIRDGKGRDSFLPRIVKHERIGVQPSKGVISWPVANQESKDVDEKRRNPEEFLYADLVGFERAIESMHKRGIGLSDDPAFSELLSTLSVRHGIDGIPAFDTMVFRSYSREDANQFMLATGQEIGSPGVRMYMDETPMGYPVLCVMTTSDFRMNPSRGGFTGSGVLMLEDIDLWGEPFTDDFDEDGSYSFAQFSRGAREAVMFIRSAVENPDVHVLATSGQDMAPDPFFVDLLGPISFVDIDTPDESERARIWQDVFSLYPSLRALGSDDLVRLSANLSRNDIYLAAREAVDQAFRASVEQRTYVPVTFDNLFNKVAAYQPLDSVEYEELEQMAIDELRADIDEMDSFLKGNE